jgi:bifunctional DNA-binding transcriptional regulator/antitoxin component of YhaV-PrlF toxin-antitoxin module
MLTTTLSTKGQIVLPSSLRRWEAGTEFWVTAHANGLRLEPKSLHKTQSAKTFSGMLARGRKALISDETAMQQAIENMVKQDSMTILKRKANAPKTLSI